MRPQSHTHDPGREVHISRGAPEARAARHASRAGTTFARFIRNLAASSGYSLSEAERYAVAVIATLEERIPIREVVHLEAQLPSRLDEILAFVPLNGLPAMDRIQFLERVAARARVSYEQADSIARRVFSFLRSQISDGEARHIEAQLPADLFELWHAAS
ncbi:MAG: hypothetical protein JWO86_6542 [Myxococcaceae bacterium]|jgi:uncharacterized protein (DUF2267 family)|nr:hypothetical protein [Myxococcaceae bacterium]MEA2748467.1 hypothetical protein [Myxococcales bacterium]